ncbi:transketolase [Afipia sp. Root123D2]|uniref:transketolase n=1 Tax=Afipia sp. Root123D2 TaxID=1736436 RepID=UPI0006F86689|nr:transketolase [Afipia sp. Root123D2]KQW19210.1 transketolase [Afipia sp. Root123D2]
MNFAHLKNDGRPRSRERDIDELCVNTIRTLTIDAVQKANSGHAGTPMGMAPVAYTLWQEVLRYDPADPLWPNRDRFVLSAGHASLLLYSLIHLSGVKRVHDGHVTNKGAVSLDDIKSFRQIDSVTPGHPEFGHTTSIETTTGPLGQGCGNSVGMAIASRWLGATYNQPQQTVFDFNVYVICSDGDLMEGVASEAASLAGHLGLDNLCWIYDSNTVTIEGHTELAFSENVAERFRSYGWHIVHVPDANDRRRVREALDEFKDTKGRPTLIVVNSIIGYGSPDKQNTSAIHSDALGEEEVRKTKKFLGWPEDAQFLVPDGVYDCFSEGIGQRGAKLRADWEKSFASYRKEYADRANEIERGLRHELPDGWDHELPEFKADAKGIATREASGKVLNAIAARVPWLLGGAADLAPSTKTKLSFDNAGVLEKATPGGRNMHFGVREHAMGAIVNGMGLCHLRAFGATFLIFSDYMRPPIRLAALMKLPVFHVFTHDSIGVGEDGPTHQPVEQLAGLRAIPNLVVLRPADANEVREAYRVIMNLKDQPAALVLSRQPLPIFDRTQFAPAAGLARGAYAMAESGKGPPQVILIGTGSEVQLCVAAYEELTSRGIHARVVSMPSWDLFERQDKSYRDSVLPPGIAARVAVEQASPLGWDRYTGLSGEIIAMHTFGASAPLKDLLTKFGFTSDKVLGAALRQIEQNKAS